MQAERITDVIAYHMEGPCWWPDWGGLRFVDMLGGDIVHLEANGHTTRLAVGHIAACVRPRAAGGFVVATERGFTLEDVDGTMTRLPDVWTDPGIRMNEGACAPDGSFYAGQMAYDKSPGAASLFRLSRDHTVTTVLAGLTISNGMDFSPDGTLAYYNDTATGRIDVFDWSAESGLTNRRPFATLPDGGRPDGLTVDADGGVWTAVSNGSRVDHFSADGQRVGVVEVPAKKVTACTFGGDDLTELFITTSREGLAEEEDPQAGSLFRAVPGARGKLPLTFGG